MNQDINLTNAAAEYLRELILNGGGSPLTFLCLAVGDGKLDSGVESASRTSLVHEVHRMPVETITKEENGRVYITARLSTDILHSDFKQRELGIYVRNGEGELLLGYVNYGENYDYIPAPGGTAAVYKTITAAFDVMNLRTTFRDLPSDDLVSFTAFNTRLNEVIPIFVNEEFTAAKEEIEESVSQAESIARDAQTSASQALESANAASGHAMTAGINATQAETSAANAAASEFNAKASETAAGTSASSADGSAMMASTKAAQAEQSATTAENSAKAASLSAEDVRRIAAEVVAMMKEIVPPRLNYNGNHFFFNQFTEPDQPDDMCVYPYAYLKKMVGGKDNYQLWLDAGNVGTLEDFLEAQKGAPGGEQDLSAITQKLESKTESVLISEDDYKNLAVKNPQTIYIIN